MQANEQQPPLAGESLAWHVRSMLSGRIMIAELASKMLLLFGLHQKTKILGISSELAVTLMSDAIMRAADKRPLAIVAARTSNLEIENMIASEFDERLRAFIRTHTAFASQEAKDWYHEHTLNKIRDLQAELNVFAIRATEGKALNLPNPQQQPQQQQKTLDGVPTTFRRPVDHKFGTKPKRTDNYHKVDMPNVVLCPLCGAFGRRHVAHTAKRHYEAIYHLRLDNTGERIANNYHMIAEIDEHSAKILERELRETKGDYTYSTYGNRFKEQQQPGANAAADKGQEEAKAMAKELVAIAEKTRDDYTRRKEAIKEEIKHSFDNNEPKEPPIKDWHEPPPPIAYLDKGRIKAFDDNYHKPDMPYYTVCPILTCRKPGRRAAAHIKGKYYDAIYHMRKLPDGSHRNDYHLLREIDEKEYNLLHNVLGQRRPPTRGRNPLLNEIEGILATTTTTTTADNKENKAIAQQAQAETT